ncbi:hypothetical protein [Pelagibius sp. Alg239-R121]|uniref:hypothetical protein n=1 Tax=Pelagibius sp. Alg239-R121 TaxID=2993448 RepID=UPI00345F3EB2
MAVLPRILVAGTLCDLQPVLWDLAFLYADRPKIQMAGIAALVASAISLLLENIF